MFLAEEEVGGPLTIGGLKGNQIKSSPWVTQVCKPLMSCHSLDQQRFHSALYACLFKSMHIWQHTVPSCEAVKRGYGYNYAE